MKDFLQAVLLDMNSVVMMVEITAAKMELMMVGAKVDGLVLMRDNPLVE
jgi:hypothetical protein